MKDSELRKEFIRVEKTRLSVQILVCKINWDGSHSPISKWVVGRKLSRKATKAEIESAIVETLGDFNYFQVCLECDKRNSIDHMHDENICQGCAETKHGVVH